MPEMTKNTSKRTIEGATHPGKSPKKLSDSVVVVMALAVSISITLVEMIEEARCPPLSLATKPRTERV